MHMVSPISQPKAWVNAKDELTLTLLKVYASEPFSLLEQHTHHG